MKKEKLFFICTECQYKGPQWLGKCPDCGEWNSLVESSSFKLKTDMDLPSVYKISEIKKENVSRVKTHLNEFDIVMGGGITLDSLTLLGGEPGVGKSTLLLEICKRVSRLNEKDKILYISGEESCEQISSRCERLNFKASNFLILNETNWNKIQEVIKKENPKYLILDSIHTTYNDELNSPAGSITQIREITFEVMNLAKAKKITTFVIGHVTKDGNIAGPKVLEHMVDTVIYFEGEKINNLRMLRSIKNRFGKSDEVGLFELNDNGISEIPSDFFKHKSNIELIGNITTCIKEGSRSLFIDIQALVSKNNSQNLKRITHGIEQSRLSLLLAIIDKYFTEPISYNDIYFNVTGGIKLQSRDSDLSIIAALYSSLKDKKVSKNHIFFGEVGLSGEIRAVPKIESRLKELERLGYNTVFLAKKSKQEFQDKYNINMIGIESVCEIQSYL